MASRTRRTSAPETAPASEQPAFEKDWEQIGGLRIRRRYDGRTQIQIVNGSASCSLTPEEFNELSAF